ncbi:exonuclease SbcCD subunit D [Actinomyces sp. 2119]|uniref:metallophosphoesterase family protein n=1 Tax=Actinomyces sp. 2119 TaxID=2321393 RepID=UPI000E6C9C0D|nr:exonuclease subunit SbcD [Actinomyces sp. 2119]RJF43278.1 exonuclease SbcCD subunit D [Actinomyces sp. 2119]
MRILHTSDWHLGRSFHGQVLDDDHAAFIDHLVTLAREELVDAVLVAGDVYDRALPPAAAVSLLDEALRRLTEITRVVLIPGNHDSARRLGFAADLMTDHLLIRARATDVGRGVVLPDAQGHEAAVVHALPYLDPDAARQSLPPVLAELLGERPGRQDARGPSQEPGQASPEEGSGRDTAAAADGPPLLPRSHEAVVSAALRLVAADLERTRSARSRRLPSLVMAHTFVVGGRASESERDIRVGGVDAVPAQVFTTAGGSPLAQACGGIDYVALGHLHRPQEVSPSPGEAGPGPRLVYPGSPLALSFEEADAAKSSVLLDVGPRGVTALERVPVPVRHHVRTVEGTMDELLSPATQDATGTDSWVRVVLRGERPPGALATLRTRFPGLLAFHHEAPAPGLREQVGVTAAADPVEVATRFLTDVGGRPPDPAERSAVWHAYEAVLAQQRSGS